MWLCEYDGSSLLDDNESSNIGHQWNAINSPNQYKGFGNNHFNDDESVDIYDDECPSAPNYLSVSQNFIEKLNDHKGSPRVSREVNGHPICYIYTLIYHVK